MSPPRPPRPAKPRRPTPSPKKPPPAPTADPRGERLQKALAAAGLGSRREIERWIAAGRVAVGGRVAELGARVRPGELIEVDGRAIESASAAQLPRVLLYHKPVGELVTRSDPQGRPTVFARLPPGRWVPVGRLDINTSGLLLLTDSGELANRLMHPRYAVEREYAVRVQGHLGPQALENLRHGVRLDDGAARFDRIEPADPRDSTSANRWYRVRLREGRKREVRRLFEAVGTRVSRLIRVRYGPVTLPRDLAAGQWRELAPQRVEGLFPG